MKLYVSRGGRTIGPVSLDDARLAVAHEKMKASDLVSTDGETWCRADEVEALASLFGIVSGAPPSVAEPSAETPIASAVPTPPPSQAGSVWQAHNSSPADRSAEATPAVAPSPEDANKPISRMLVVGTLGLTLGLVVPLVALVFSFRVSGELSILGALCYGIPGAVLGMGSGALIGAVLAAVLRRLRSARAQWSALAVAIAAVMCFGCFSGVVVLAWGGGMRQHVYTTGMDIGGPSAAYWGLVTCTEGPYGSLSGDRVAHGRCPTDSNELSPVDNPPVASCTDGPTITFAYTEAAAAQVRRDCSGGLFERLDGAAVSESLTS